MGEFVHSKDVHQVEGKEKPQRENCGLYNLISLVALLSIGRYLIEDYKDYGFIMNLPLRELTVPDTSFFLLCLCVQVISSLLVFLIERRRLFVMERAVYKNKKEKRSVVPHSSTLYSLLFVSCLVVSNMLSVFITYFFIEHVYVSGWALIVSIVVSIKLISFYLVYNELNPPSSGLVFKQFLYFLIVPTLCYQLDYPMNSCRRLDRILRRAVQFVLGIFLFVFVMDQYSISSIYRAMETDQILIKIENIINVAISTAFLFLIFFHLVFMCALDIIAELTLFKDRNFYQAWWNSSTVGEFWSLWNIPVHLWFKRHLYVPLLRRGTSKQLARACCFFVSAVLHEVVLSIATKKFSGLVFLGMIFQIPNIYVSEMVERVVPSMANIFFWCSFCVIGQPAIVLLYYRSKYLKEIN